MVCRGQNQFIKLVFVMMVVFIRANRGPHLLPSNSDVDDCCREVSGSGLEAIRWVKLAACAGR
jgi:hypothetical protein